jgi:hypothetical protein
MVAILSLLVGSMLLGRADAKAFGAIEISTTDQNGEALEGACFQILSGGQSWIACDNSEEPSGDDKTLPDLESTAGTIRITGLVGTVVVRLDSYPATCDQRSTDIEEQRVNVIPESLDSVKFVIQCINNSPPEVSSNSQSTAGLSAQIDDLTQKVAELETRINSLESSSDGIGLPPQLVVGEDIQVFGAMIYTVGGLQPDKSIYLLCQQPPMQTRPTDTLLQCGWLSGLYPD